MKQNADEQYTLGGIVIPLLTTNTPSFPMLPYPTGTLTTVNNTLHTTYLAYKQNGEIAKGAFENAQADWKIKFTKTADYVDAVADGDLATINKSGFPATKSETNPSTHLGVMPNIDIYGTRPSGTVHGSFDAVTGSSFRAGVYMLATAGYEFQQNGNQLNIIHAGQIIASVYISTSRAADFQGLPTLTPFVGKAAGLNPAGLGDISGGISLNT
ncbi:MAG: hypothetical protein NTX03_11430 [Bacteroidetes bacterium]|nr:hypothetical protein [Bacteroidota bacterium]